MPAIPLDQSMPLELPEMTDEEKSARKILAIFKHRNARPNASEKSARLRVMFQTTFGPGAEYDAGVLCAAHRNWFAVSGSSMSDQVVTLTDAGYREIKD